MTQWGRNDQAVTANSTTTKETSNGAPIGTYTAVKLGGGANAHFGNTSAGSRAATDVAMFNNTTVGAFVSGKAVGVFGVDAVEAGIKTGNLALTYVTSGGTGYNSTTPVVTITFANGTTNVSCVNATVNTTSNAGRVTALNINVAAAGLTTNPTVSIATPSAINITANSTGFSNTTETLVVSTANSKWQVGDRLYYGVPTGNTPIQPLTGNTYYYVSFANTTTIKLATTSGGANIDLTDARVTNPGEVHTIMGDTATGYVTINGAQGVSHAGWVLRTEGTGGRAGRVHYETLVAMGSLGAQTAAYGTPASVADASDDTILPDA
ncbi:hypothetical protein UFOVP787_24 [uncultured Caudovirales phage]|uniref:Uncharacterized protein n=1 Tax=uncultured Caudovirales phage TaxID=2100421 RepID=A0A6J5NTX2_9CAUD|nr:hypothetical protein UFOVP787_24 [uncultured Caudovirales phage]